MQFSVRCGMSETKNGDGQEYFNLPALNSMQLALLVRAVDILGSAAYGGWQESETEMSELLASQNVAPRRGCQLPALNHGQLDLLIRGVEALGTIDGWQQDEKEMNRLLNSLRWGTTGPAANS